VTTEAMTATQTVTLEVFRYHPDTDTEPSYQSYEVPYREEWVVLDALNWLKDEVDGTLSYRWSCRMGVCGSCGMMVNGYPRLTCNAFLREFMPGPIRVEPLRGFPVERDMVTVLDDFMEKAREDQKTGRTSRGVVELVSQFSERFPIRVIAGMLGLPEEDNEYFEAVYDRLFAGNGYGRAHFRRGVAARDELFAYLDPMFDERIAEPRDDLLSVFCHAEKDGAKMTRDQMRGYVALLLVGGGDTTHKAIDAMWWNLLRNYEQYEAVRDDPELMDRVFTEMLRFDGSNHWQRRRTKVEVEIHGRVLPVGATAWLGLGSGNRDERIFKDPDTFNIFRDDLYFGKELRTGYWQDGVASHLGFGQETHFCMGYALARQESVVSSRILLERLKNPRLADVPNEGIAFPPPGRGGVRGLQHLEIEFDL